jgi:prolyl-tRNA synthetase
MLEVYADFAENYMAMPVIKGRKTEGERFPGAVDTLCIESMMQDRKALQAGTSHYLGQNFAKSCNIQFQDEKGTQQYAHTTSWGVSTRLIGGMIMTHSDDDGFVAPPRLAPQHVVICPIYKDDATKADILAYCQSLQEGTLRPALPRPQDRRDRSTTATSAAATRPGVAIKKGVPLRVEVGPRDFAANAVFVARRDTGEKAGIPRAEFVATVVDRLQAIQDNLLARAKAYRAAHTREIDTWEELKAYFTAKNPERPEIHGGFAMCHWNGSKAVEKRLKDELKVTIRCIPLDAKDEPGK